MNDTLRTLYAAKAIVNQPGVWARDPKGAQHCASTAIAKAARSNFFVPACVFAEANDIANGEPGFVGGNIWRWNDHPDRTLDEVNEAFDKAIAAVS
jgi:hypothetical protein